MLLNADFYLLYKFIAGAIAIMALIILIEFMLLKYFLGNSIRGSTILLATFVANILSAIAGLILSIYFLPSEFNYFSLIVVCIIAFALSFIIELLLILAVLEKEIHGKRIMMGTFWANFTTNLLASLILILNVQ